MPAKPKPPKSKQGERRKLEKKLWRTMSLYIRLRDGHCVTCLTPDGLTMSHYVPAGKQRLRYDERNCNAQCKTCNNMHNFYPQFYADYMYRHYDSDDMKEIIELSRINAWKWSVPELRGMLEYYESKLEEMA